MFTETQASSSGVKECAHRALLVPYLCRTCLPVSQQWLRSSPPGSPFLWPASSAGDLANLWDLVGQMGWEGCI